LQEHQCSHVDNGCKHPHEMGACRHQWKDVSSPIRIWYGISPPPINKMGVRQRQWKRLVITVSASILLSSRSCSPYWGLQNKFQQNCWWAHYRPSCLCVVRLHAHLLLRQVFPSSQLLVISLLCVPFWNLLLLNLLSHLDIYLYNRFTVQWITNAQTLLDRYCRHRAVEISVHSHYLWAIQASKSLLTTYMISYLRTCCYVCQERLLFLFHLW
jgi:hypothetical protein